MTIKYIQDSKKRDVALSKRKRSILKKLIEFSQLCGVDVFLTMFDKEKQKITEYRSENEFDIKIVSALLSKDTIKNLRYEFFRNDISENFRLNDKDIEEFKITSSKMNLIKQKYKVHEDKEQINVVSDSLSLSYEMQQKLTQYVIPELQLKSKRDIISSNRSIVEAVNTKKYGEVLS